MANIHVASAAQITDPSGVYVRVDSYNQSDLGNLNNAAAAAATAMQNGVTSCAGAPAVEPYCSDTNGVLLSVDWCRFQGYSDANAPVSGTGETEFSCHYSLIRQADNSIVQYHPSGKDSHICDGTRASTTFDTCSQSSTGVSNDLYTVLQDILTINRFRLTLTQSASPLRISVGLAAGTNTPEYYFLQQNSGNTIPLSQPFNMPISQTNTVAGCGLEPQPWFPSFITAYETAYYRLLLFVHNTITNATPVVANQSRITLVKITPLNATTLEYFLPGLSTAQTPITEPNSRVTDDVPVNCTGTATGAASWVTNYNLTPITITINQAQVQATLIQALEQTLGTISGFLYGELQNLNESQAYLSIATTNGAAYPQVQCSDQHGAGTCTAQTTLSDQWSTYWLFYHVRNLFVTNAIAKNAAIAAYMSLFNNTTNYALTPSVFYVNTTNLQNPNSGTTMPCPNFPPHTPPSYSCQAVSQASLSCNLNNTIASSQKQGTFQLGGAGMTYSFTGIGTQLGVQTVYNLDNGSSGATNYCTTTTMPNLTNILSFGVANGAQYIELTPDIAYDSACQLAIQSLLGNFPNSTYKVCLYN